MKEYHKELEKEENFISRLHWVMNEYKVSDKEAKEILTTVYYIEMLQDMKFIG